MRETCLDASKSCSLLKRASARAPSSYDGSGVNAESLYAYGEGVSKYTRVTVAVVEVGGLTDSCIIANAAAIGDESTDRELFSENNAPFACGWEAGRAGGVDPETTTGGVFGGKGNTEELQSRMMKWKMNYGLLKTGREP